MLFIFLYDTLMVEEATELRRWKYYAIKHIFRCAFVFLLHSINNLLGVGRTYLFHVPYEENMKVDVNI